MKFEHPLARGAQVWSGKFRDGRAEKILVVVTTIELNSENKRFNKRAHERLSRAADEFVKNADDVGGFVLINRLRDWQGKPE